MNYRKNANVSSNPRVSAEGKEDLAKLYVVNRSYNVRSHGSQKASCWSYFGFLFYCNNEIGKLFPILCCIEY